MKFKRHIRIFAKYKRPVIGMNTSTPDTPYNRLRALKYCKNALKSKKLKRFVIYIMRNK